ncbi:protein C1orf43 homolog [Oppia nitens]|uniref:protein C1orf43 homolog n=1 Tax=Oppia nitens TaxID=1686743 RepID=UPI0023DA6782|nr:protein C1orf43 homolog [Oppia nitens]
MAEEYNMSGVAAIICIAIGILIFVLLFIFAKRQIMRLSLKNRFVPHIPLARDAPKSMRQRIEAKLNVVRDITFEPNLMNKGDNDTNDAKQPLYDHIYRMKAVDSLTLLEADIIELTGNYNLKRPPGQDLRYYLLKLVRDDGPLANCDTKLINQFVDSYNGSRHEPYPVFNLDNYNQFMTLLNTIRNSIQNKTSNRKTKLKGKDTTAQMVFNGKTQVSIRQNKVDFVDTDETSV